MSRPRPAALALHATAACIMSWGYSALNSSLAGEWVRAQKCRDFQFLTIQGLGVAWLTMIVSLAVDIFPLNTALRDAKRALLMVSMPLETIISSIYWTLILLFPRLILMDNPPASEPSFSSTSPALLRIPLTIDLALHLAPGIALVLDFFFLEKKYTRYQVICVAPLAAALFGIWYVSWVECCSSHNGRFPYPFLEHPYYIRALFYIGAVVQGFLSFRFLNSLHS